MNWVDWVILIVWASAAFLGYRIGVLGMVCSLAAFIVAGFLAGPVGSLFTFLPTNATVETMAGFVVVFTLEMAAVKVVTTIWKPVTDWIPLVGFVNGVGGGIVGFVLGFMLLLVVMAGIERLPAGEFRSSLENATGDSSLAGLVVNDYNLFDKLLDWTRTIAIPSKLEALKNSTGAEDNLGWEDPSRPWPAGDRAIQSSADAGARLTLCS